MLSNENYQRYLHSTLVRFYARNGARSAEKKGIYIPHWLDSMDRRLRACNGRYAHLHSTLVRFYGYVTANVSVADIFTFHTG